MIELLSLKKVMVDVFGYPLSYIEFFSALTGLVAVFLASRNKIISWPIGLLNVSSAFFIYYQVQLYADMGLQIYFFITGIIGWYYWIKQKSTQKKITLLNPKQRWFLLIVLCSCTLIFGYLANNLQQLFPSLFNENAAFPYWDGFTTSLSMAGNVLLAFRKFENWILWILVNIVSMTLYYLKGIHFFSFEYFVFLIIAILGILSWYREYRSYENISVETMDLKIEK